jgi:hypothetical protein
MEDLARDRHVERFCIDTKVLQSQLVRNSVTGSHCIPPH